VVLYGPNSIIREFARVRPEADGTWAAPVPPPGAYRIMVVGDGSTPLPVLPGFRAVKVLEGTGQAELDFDIHSTP
jgi:hypothetical protein